MEELEKLSYMYPSAITIIIVVMALFVLYVTGRSLAYVFKTTEEKLKSEPSVLTELDELRRSNEKLSTMYDQSKDQLKTLDALYESDMETHHRLVIDYYDCQDRINELKTTILSKDAKIAELEKELSDLRSSCDDSFLNTVDRANQLSLKCASLENIIAEFDVYKKDAQRTYDTLKAEYNNKITEIDKLNKRIAELEKSFNDANTQIFGELSWAKYVATDEDGEIFAILNKPFKGSSVWGNSSGKYELISLYQAIILCGREPKWQDDEPTYVGKNL